MRDFLGRFIRGPRSSGKYVPVRKSCFNCGAIKIMLNSIRFCSNKCYLNYRSNNMDKFPKPNFSEEQRILNRIRVKENSKNPEFKKKHREATILGMKSKEVLIKMRRKRNPLTDIHKTNLSESHIGRRPKNFNGYCVQTKQGWISFPNEKKYYMLSTWERNIARYFEFLKSHKEIIDWFYEPKRFVFEKINFGTRTYLPDFLIKNKDGKDYYVEVKGYMDKESATKLKRMKKYFPEIEIRLIQKQDYMEIKKSVAPLLKDWE